MYSSDIKRAIASAPRNLGTELGRIAVRLDFPVTRIAQCVGATRQTIYNWITGEAQVSPAYTDRVRALLVILGSAKNAEEAWGKACRQFSLRA